ncbi:MAG: lysylphosphatidylglycerol synthase transmembrane domain-containing protein [Nanoarchaeota archaeon]|nr:lysylphosphatidylglycerol synthase transmembrane domain-containing protein [Nanoarchaeota archaeon]
MKITSVFFRIIIGVAILGILVYKIGMKSIIDSISKVNIGYVLPMVLIVLFVNVFGTWKLLLFFKPTKISVSFPRLYRLYLLSGCLSSFIPGRVGELFLIYFLKKDKVRLGVGSAVVVMDKLIGVIVTFSLALVGIFIFFSITQSLKIIVLFLFFLFIVVYMVFSDFGRKLIKKYILRKWESKFVGFSKTLFLLLKNKKAMFYNIMLSFVKWIVNSLVLYTLFIAMEYRVSLFVVVVVASTLAIVSLIPVSINGLGIKESAGVAFFAVAGVPVLVSTSVLLLFLIFNYLVAFVCIFLLLDAKEHKLRIREMLDQ